MNRAPTDEIEYVERYSRTNPPAGDEQALLAIDELKISMVNIEAQLEHADPRTFPNNNGYREWRARAMSALGWNRREYDFLQAWVREQESKRAQVMKQDANRDLDIVAQNLRAHAVSLGKKIGDSYVPHYSSTQPPKNMTAARERMLSLVAYKQEIEVAFSEITAAWTKHSLRRIDLQGVKFPIQKVLVQIEAEIGVVKEYIRTHNDNWIHISKICKDALTRAVAEGFVLTPAEQEVLTELQDRYKKHR